MKRRVIRVGDRRFRVYLPGEAPTDLSYREKARRWDPDENVHVDFEPEEERYLLSWEGVFIDSFRREEDALLFIIRLGYSIPDKHLVPSEILADFNLVYEAGDWVDEWGCPDQHEVIFTERAVRRPESRKIRFEGYPQITEERPSSPNWPWGVDNDYAPPSGSRYEIAAEIKIPELDFEELEKPKKRLHEIPRTWADRSESAFGGYWFRRREIVEIPPDAECVFVLKSGEEAKKAYQERKSVK